MRGALQPAAKESEKAGSFPMFVYYPLMVSVPQTASTGFQVELLCKPKVRQILAQHSSPGYIDILCGYLLNVGVMKTLRIGLFTVTILFAKHSLCAH